VSFSDGHTCQIEMTGTVRNKLSDGMVRELKDMRYVSQLKKNFILVGALEAHDLRTTLGEGILKVSSGLLVVLRGNDGTTYTT